MEREEVVKYLYWELGLGLGLGLQGESNRLLRESNRSFRKLTVSSLLPSLLSLTNFHFIFYFGSQSRR